MYSFAAPPTIWERLTAAGRRSLVIDPTLAWAPRTIQGTFLSGWQYEDRLICRGLSVPRTARSSLARRRGAAPVLNDVYGSKDPQGLLELRDALIRAPGRAADATVDLLDGGFYDLVWVNFGSAHKAGHHLWDPALVVHRSLSADVESSLRNGLADVYEAVDAAIGRIVAALPSGSDVIVFSPTGMGANTSRADLLPGMLDAVLSGSPARGKTRGHRSPIWALRSAIPAPWRDRAAGLLPDGLVADLMTRLYFRRDWTRTPAIAVPGENKGYIRLNLRGRERAGIVDKTDADALMQTIIEGLLTFRDPDGAPAITRVERMADMTTEVAALDRLPDLVVHWGERPAGRLTHVTSPRVGDVLRRGDGSGRSGNHVDDAWAVIVPGTSALRDLGRAPRITDIGATACAIAGVETTGLSGESLLEHST